MNWTINGKNNRDEQEAATDYLFTYPTNKDGSRTDYADQHMNYVHDALKANQKKYSDFICSVIDTMSKRRTIQKFLATDNQLKVLSSYFSSSYNAGKLSDLYLYCHDKLTALEKRAGSSDAQKLAEDKTAVEIAQMYLDMKAKYLEAERDRKELLSENIRLNNAGKGNGLNKTWFK